MSKFPSDLSLHELTIAEILTTDKNIKQIALERKCTVGNIKYHITNIYRKCGVKTRSQFILKYLFAQEMPPEQGPKAVSEFYNFPETFSQIEIEISEFLMEGVGAKDIAFDRSRSIKSIKNHITSIYWKSSVTCRQKFIEKFKPSKINHNADEKPQETQASSEQNKLSDIPAIVELPIGDHNHRLSSSSAC